LLSLIPTPIGNLDDITYRALKTLSSVKTIFCEDTRVTKKLLSLLSERFEIKPLVKDFIPLHEHNQKEVLLNIDISVFNEDCCYVSDAGMPSISDPGSALIRFCQENSIELVSLAKEDKIDPVIGRDEQLQRMISIELNISPLWQSILMCVCVS
jgi:16S rRNA (cytidine1402-2'-O)-methyltransferase